MWMFVWSHCVPHMPQKHLWRENRRDQSICQDIYTYIHINHFMQVQIPSPVQNPALGWRHLTRGRLNRQNISKILKKKQENLPRAAGFPIKSINIFRLRLTWRGSYLSSNYWFFRLLAAGLTRRKEVNLSKEIDIYIFKSHRSMILGNSL